MFSGRKKKTLFDACLIATKKIDETLFRIMPLVGSLTDQQVILDRAYFDLRQNAFALNWKFAVFKATRVNSVRSDTLCDFATTTQAKGDALLRKPVSDFCEATSLNRETSGFYEGLVRTIFDASFNCGWRSDYRRMGVIDAENRKLVDFIPPFSSDVQFVSSLVDEYCLSY